MKDLFEYYQEQPEALKTICDKWQTRLEKNGLTYEDCERFRLETESIGYTFDYELSADPFNLRLMDINFKEFTLKQFKAVYKGLKFMLEPTINDDEKLTISDYFFCDNINKGGENLYFDFIVHEVNPDSVTEYKLAVYTKENHDLLKSLIINIIKQI